jgi:hypothetical protein
MKKITIIIIIASTIAGISWGMLKISKKVINIGKKIETESHLYNPENFFPDQKIVELCYAVKKGDIEKMEELVKLGVDINTIGKDGMTPFLWTIKFSKIRDIEIIKKDFKWFVEHKADPTKIYDASLQQGYSIRAHYTVFHTVAKSSDSFYLKTLLESNLIKNIDVELPENSHPTALLQAELSDQFENFKLLLDYGADKDKKIGKFKKATLNIVEGNMSWQFAYEILKRGANFNTNMRGGQSEIVRVIEDIVFHPSVSLNYRGADYRQKCVEYLENHGVPKIHPDMPADEKYEKENGKYQLYILEKEGEKKEQWVKFEDSSRYKPEKDNGVYQEDVE